MLLETGICRRLVCLFPGFYLTRSNDKNTFCIQFYAKRKTAGCHFLSVIYAEINAFKRELAEEQNICIRVLQNGDGFDGKSILCFIGKAERRERVTFDNRDILDYGIGDTCHDKSCDRHGQYDFLK